MLKDMVFWHLQENLEIKYGKKLMDTATKTGIDAAKTASKRVVQKTAEATGDLIGNKISDKVPKFITKKWIEVHDQSGNADDRYKPSKQIRFKTSMLQSDLCDYSDACIVEGRIIVKGVNNTDRLNRS